MVQKRRQPLPEQMLTNSKYTIWCYKATIRVLHSAQSVHKNMHTLFKWSPKFKACACFFSLFIFIKLLFSSHGHNMSLGFLYLCEPLTMRQFGLNIYVYNFFVYILANTHFNLIFQLPFFVKTCVPISHIIVCRW